MKKSLYILLFSVLLLSGCEKKPVKFAPAVLFDLKDNVTSAGIKIGDGPREFKAAYSDYTIQAAFDDASTSYRIMPIHKIPYNENISTIIANFFIDGEPVSEDWICEENQVDISGLHELLSSQEYLRNHEVIYRYLFFKWEDGVVANITSKELNYNETFETPRLD